MNPSHIVVLGTSGGVGVTTVAAVIADGIAGMSGNTPGLADHTGGELTLRMPVRVGALGIDPSVIVHDLGSHPSPAALERLAGPQTLFVMVIAATRRALEAPDLRGATALALGALVVPVATFGRHAVHGSIESLRGQGVRVLDPIPQDAALATGGAVPSERLKPETRAAFVRTTAEVMRLLPRR